MQGPQFFDGPIFLPHGRLPLALRAAEITQKWGAFHQIGESRQQSIADRQMPPNARVRSSTAQSISARPMGSLKNLQAAHAPVDKSSPQLQRRRPAVVVL
jgi:hypothetical protein